MTKETPANGTRGFIIKDFFSNEVYFRVYNEDKSFIDYQIGHNDLEVVIADESASFYCGKNKNVLDYNSIILGKKN